MADLSTAVTKRVVGTEEFTAKLVTKEVERERADLTSPGGTRPMRRSYLYQPTPPKEWFGERAEQVHKENIIRRVASDAEFADAIANKAKYAARRRDIARRAKNKAADGLARRVSDSAAARTARGARPKSRSRTPCLPTAVACWCEGQSAFRRVINGRERRWLCVRWLASHNGLHAG